MQTRGGELETQEFPAERPLLWAPPFRRAEDFPPYLFVRDGHRCSAGCCGRDAERRRVKQEGSDGRGRNVRIVEAKYLDGAINSHQLLSIDFLQSAFSE